MTERTKLPESTGYLKASGGIAGIVVGIIALMMFTGAGFWLIPKLGTTDEITLEVSEAELFGISEIVLSLLPTAGDVIIEVVPADGLTLKADSARFDLTDRPGLYVASRCSGGCVASFEPSIVRDLVSVTVRYTNEDSEFLDDVEIEFVDS